MFNTQTRSTFAIFALAVVPAACAMAQDSAQWGPFSAFEAGQLSAVWHDIRSEPDYDDIDWRSAGLRDVPGDRLAQELMEDHWDELRRAEWFEDIDWQATTAYSTSASGPFSAREADQMREVWPQIREAAAFDQIDWRDAGLRYAPGDERARDLMADHWDSLRKAARFDDIDWRQTTGD